MVGNTIGNGNTFMAGNISDGNQVTVTMAGNIKW